MILAVEPQGKVPEEFGVISRGCGWISIFKPPCRGISHDDLRFQPEALGANNVVVPHVQVFNDLRPSKDLFIY